MKFSSEGTVLTSKHFFKNSSKNVPLCKEFTISNRNGILSYCWKIALIFVFVVCVIHHAVFVDYEDFHNKCYIISFFVSCIIFLFISLSSTVEKESLLLVVPLTLQMTTTYIFGNTSSFSMAWQALGDFMIIEVIMGHQIHYFLSVVIDKTYEKNEEMEHLLLFRNSKPPLKCLEILYRDLQLILDKSR